jgi:hypothetical protein
MFEKLSSMRLWARAGKGMWEFLANYVMGRFCIFYFTKGEQ